MGILHFLDVGQGDCSIIEHRSGRTTMIDVCKARTVKTTIASLYAPPPPSAAAALGLLGSAMPQQALSPAARDLLNALLPPPPDFVDPIEYMRARNISAPFRYIQSHPEADHMDGIADLCAEFPPANFWDTDNTCGKTGGFAFGGYRREDWEFYLSIRDGRKVGGPKRLVLHAGDQGQFWNAVTTPGEVHDGLHVLAPTRELVRAANRSGDFNDSSYVILWWTPAGRVLFCGDSHDDTWDHILATYGAWVANVDIMIAPHHGRDSGRERRFLNIVRPKLTLFGWARSEHLMYDALHSRELTLITATQAGTVVVDALGTSMRIFVANEACARKRNSNTWYDPYGGWYLGSINQGRAAA